MHLAKFPTKAPHVIYGPGENAGAIDIGEGLAAIFKMESHNHPSFIEPFQGAATGVGGILRDVFTMGARPVAIMNALRFGRMDHPRTKMLVHGVVAGIAGMSYRRFALFNVVGGIGWVFSMTMVGYSLIKIFPRAEKHIHIIIVVVIVLSILPAVIEILRARLRKP